MDVNEHDDLPPLPTFSPTTSPKRLRAQRLVSSPAILTTKVVSTPAPDQVISSLINSLTAISQSKREQLHREFGQPQPRDTLYEDDSDDDLPTSPGSFYGQNTYAPSIIPASDLGYESDDDHAAAPVIRFSRPPPSPKKRRKERSDKSQERQSNQSSIKMIPERTVSLRNSTQSLRSLNDPKESGMSGLDKRNGSSVSLAVSLMSIRTRSRSPTKTAPAETSHDQSPTSLRPLPDRTYSDSVLRPERISSLWDRSSVDTSLHSIDESQTSNTLSPLNREKLGEHLIPSRQSSIRTTQRRGHHRHSTGSRELKDLLIDEELIGSDNSTVRRIKELQEAKEKRHSEWRKDSSPQEISPKRHSAPSPKPLRRSSTHQSSKLSVTEVLVESEYESPQLSAQISAADLALMPALQTHESSSPLTPVERHSGGNLPAPLIHQPQVSVPTLSAPVPPKDRTSTQNKRMSMLSNRDSKSDDIKSIWEEVEAFLSASRLTQKLRHPRTGRTIAFSEVGDPKGFVVFCCVGMGLTRYVMSFYDELARTLKLRLITPDRPGVGESEAVPERLSNPLTWVDDIEVICEALEVSRFSLLAHSAGTIYAMAAALKLPQFVRGRIHLLAPWIPPSQMSKGASMGPDAQPVVNQPMSHRILSVLPTSMLKVANSRFLSTTNASVDIKTQPGRKKQQMDILERELSQTYAELNNSSFSLPPELDRSQMFRNMNKEVRNNTPSPELRTSTTERPSSPRISGEARAALYNSHLTHRIWTMATLNANPAIDLMTCLERKKPIGFRYADITRAIVIRHGAKDTRVPLDNVKFLDSVLKRSELRILENEGHSLMANAHVMSSTLLEISQEWAEWDKIARYKEKKKRDPLSSSASAHSARR